MHPIRWVAKYKIVELTAVGILVYLMISGALWLTVVKLFGGSLGIDVNLEIGGSSG